MVSSGSDGCIVRRGRTAAHQPGEEHASGSNQCQTALKEAELKVEKLVEKNGKQTLEPFEAEDE